MRLGDKILVYHSNAFPSCVVGIATVCRESYPDHTAWDPNDPHFDPKSSPDNPRWMMVDIRFESKFVQALSLELLKQESKLEGMELLRKGSRLSVQPVRESEYRWIVQLGAGSNKKRT
jgi:predicted RNA-binding protein with PUA-like domain